MKQIYCHTWLEPQMCNQFYMESLVLYYEVQYLSMNIDRCDTLFTDNYMFDHICTWKSMINIICSFDLFHIDYILIVYRYRDIINLEQCIEKYACLLLSCHQVDISLTLKVIS